jgi:hypothetical protein
VSARETFILLFPSTIMSITTPVTCPTCFEEFEVPAPYIDEVPCDVDYDCEVCCRPMRISFEESDGEVIGNAYGLGD